MESYRTEEEQVEALKRWWQENGRSTLMGIALAVALVVGWQGWQRSQETAAAQASVSYQQMLQALASEDAATRDRGLTLARELKDQHPGSTYAQFAALYLARVAVQEGDSSDAETQLRWVLAKADGDMKDLAQLRLAQVLAEQGDSEQALELLAPGQGGAMAAAYAMARGDVLLAAGRRDEARLAYEAAATDLSASGTPPPTLVEKLDFLNPRQATAPEAG